MVGKAKVSAQGLKRIGMINDLIKSCNGINNIVPITEIGNTARNTSISPLNFGTRGNRTARPSLAQTINIDHRAIKNITKDFKRVSLGNDQLISAIHMATEKFNNDVETSKPENMSRNKFNKEE
jgi:hypothetical protein